MPTEYPPRVVALFDAPVNLAPLTPAPARVVVGEAGALSSGTRVVFEADVDDGVIRRLAFRAYGCPYVIATCSQVTQQLAQQPAAALNEWSPVALAAELDVPAEKFGSLLIIQDALRNCFRGWDTRRLPAGDDPLVSAPEL